MSATRATEESEEHRAYNQRHRGRKVMLAYTMQVRTCVIYCQYLYVGLFLCAVRLSLPTQCLCYMVPSAYG